jgi:hypothetical protein
VKNAPLRKSIINFVDNYVLGVNRKSTNAGVKAELGRRPLLIEVLRHSFKYWLYLCEKDISELVRHAYLDSYTCSGPGSWASKIKLLLCSFSLSHVWQDQGSKFKSKMIKTLNLNMFADYDKQWHNLVCKPDSKLRTYGTFKTEYCLENYFWFSCTDKRREFSKLRISAHQLRIESGRYTRPRKTPLQDRTCLVCKGNSVEDETHFVLHCPAYSTERKLLFDELASFTKFKELNDEDKFIFLMSYNNGDIEILKYILDFITLIVDKRKTLLMPK